jgi:16S rRNA (guanine527-N7)-methyltransferase
MNFKESLKDLKIELTDEQLRMFEIYYTFLLEYNQITNLTRITDYEEVFIKHFYDSLTLADAVDMKEISTLCDMGSGAGFPSLPLKIIYPHLNITIIDSLNKRIKFLEQLVVRMNLENVTLVHDRVEVYAINHQDSFDLVTARALGSMALIVEMGLPMMKKSGRFVAYKALQYEEEIEASKNALKVLGSEIDSIKHFDLPNAFGSRVLILIKKNKSIHGYPRSFAIMTKKPL